MNHVIRWTLIVFPCAAVLSPATSFAQEEANKGLPQNSKGPAVRGRAPGLRVRDGVNGPEITQTKEEAEAPSRQQQLVIDVLGIFFESLNTVIPLLPEIFVPGTDGPVAIGDLVLTEIANDGTNTFAELFNPSGIRLELDNWAFCREDQCTGSNELAFIVLDPGDILVVQLGGTFDSSTANAAVSLQVDTSVGEIGLYDFTGAPSRDPTDGIAMVDYLRWGDPLRTFGLEDVAASVGLWQVRTSIDSTVRNNSFQLSSDRLDRGGLADDYIVVPFDDASLGLPTLPDVGMDSE